MGRVVTSSDDESSSDEDDLHKAKRPNLGAGRNNDPISLDSSSDEEESGDDEEGFIARSDDEASGSDDDESNSAASGDSEPEFEGSESGDSSAGEEPDSLPRDVHYTEVDRRFRAGEMHEEPQGYRDLPQLHAPNPAALWDEVSRKAQEPGFVEKWGIRVVERTVNGKRERIMHRVDYGSAHEHMREQQTGSYKKVLVPMIEMLFGQQPYIAPPDFTRKSVYSEPEFLDFVAEFHADAREDGGEALSATNAQGYNHGPLWCICTQCSHKKLDTITVMRHKPSGIYVAVGGSCANKMVGYEDLKQMHDLQLNGQYQNDTVSRLLGLA